MYNLFILLRRFIMKVILSLAGQNIPAIKAAIEAAKETNSYHEGNGFSFNENQEVKVDGNTLIVEGERYPLLQDAFGDMLLSLKDAKVLKYQTSNKEMYWYENTCAYLRRINSVEVAVAAIAAGATIIPDEVEGMILAKYGQFFQYNINTRVVNATLTREELVELKIIRKSEWFYRRYHFKG
jgi:hypothetical protein